MAVCSGLQWCVVQQSNLVPDELEASVHAGFALVDCNFGETLAKDSADCLQMGLQWSAGHISQNQRRRARQAASTLTERRADNVTAVRVIKLAHGEYT